VLLYSENSSRIVLGLLPEGEGTMLLCISISDFCCLDPEDEDIMLLQNAINYLVIDRVWHQRRLELSSVVHILCVVAGRKAAKRS
jgi:hypothetical protein